MAKKTTDDAPLNPEPESAAAEPAAPKPPDPIDRPGVACTIRVRKEVQIGVSLFVAGEQLGVITPRAGLSVRELCRLIESGKTEVTA